MSFARPVVLAAQPIPIAQRSRLAFGGAMAPSAGGSRRCHEIASQRSQRISDW